MRPSSYEKAKQAVEQGLDESKIQLGKHWVRDTQLVRTTAKNLIIKSQAVKLRTSEELSKIEKSQLPLAMKQEQQKMSQLMDSITQFQLAVNNYMGIKIEMAYVWLSPKTGRIEMGRENLTAQELSIDRKSSSHGGGLSARYKITANKVAAMKRFQAQLESYDSKYLDEALLTSYDRYRSTRKKLGQSYGLVWWKTLKNKTSAVRMSSAGPLGEAYIAFYSNLYKGFKNNLEQNIETFILHNQYGAIKADTMSGFLYGDVQGADGTYYAVKMKGASAMGTEEIIALAKQIESSTNVSSVISAFEERTKHKKAELVKIVGEKIDLNIEEIIENLKKKTK